MREVNLINNQGKRRHLVHALWENILQRPLLLAALALYWTWINMAYQSTLFFPLVVLGSGAIAPSWVGPMSVSALSYLVIGIRFRNPNPLARRPRYVFAVAACMSAGALFCFVWIDAYGASVSHLFALLVYVLGSIGIGVGTACLLVEWGRVFGYLGPYVVLCHGIVAMLCSAAFVACVSFLPDVLGRFVFVVIPFPLAWCYAKATGSLPRKTLLEQGLDAEVHVPYKFLVTALLHGLALGVLMGAAVGQAAEFGDIFITALSFIFAAFLLLLTVIFMRMDFNHLIYQVGFGIMATGAVMIACFDSAPLVGESLQLVGFCYVHLIMWGLCSYLTKRFSLSAAWVVAWPTCALMLGQIGGGVVGSVLAQQPESDSLIQDMATLVAFVLLMAALLMMSNRNISTGWGIASPANGAAIDGPLSQAAEAVAVEVGLTPKETEVFGLLARGRSRRAISEEMVVSEETVKSHTKAIYRKLSVHSQQELLDFVEARAKDLSGANGDVSLE